MDVAGAMVVTVVFTITRMVVYICVYLWSTCIKSHHAQIMLKIRAISQHFHSIYISLITSTKDSRLFLGAEIIPLQCL